MKGIADLLEPQIKFKNNKGVPLSPVMQVSVCLNHYAGGHFQRITGLCRDISQNAARESMIRVTDALVNLKAQFIFMSTEDEMQETSERMFHKYHLPRFCCAVDGMMVIFSEAPRKLPQNKNPQQFWCRKQKYAENVQLVCNDRYILDLVLGWPGSTHDSRIWKRSEVKAYIESQRRFYIAGDSGYPISEVLLKPYSTNEAGRDPRKRLFNKRLSGIRTVMSECIFGCWKRRFPILKNMRTDFDLSQKIILATAVLFNLGRRWGDEEDSEDEEEEEHERAERAVVVEGDAASVRLRGQVERDRLKDGMR